MLHSVCPTNSIVFWGVSTLKLLDFIKSLGPLALESPHEQELYCLSPECLTLTLPTDRDGPQDILKYKLYREARVGSACTSLLHSKFVGL